MIYLQQVKQSNMALVLERLWQAGQLSRVELVSLTGLTSGTLTNLTHELIERRVLRENEAVSGNVGRKRIMLGFDPGHYRILGLDIGRSSAELVLMDLNGAMLYSEERDMTGLQGPAAYMPVLETLIGKARMTVEADGGRILGLGVGVPGPIDYERGALLHPPNFPGWGGYALQQELERRFGYLTVIEDDARTAAMAERWYGIGKQVSHMFSVTMGIGIGGGMLADGKVVRGTNGLCGQVGHMTMVLGGRLCDCGNRGCWETVGSIPALLERWGQGDTLDALEASARRGEPEALRCLEETMTYLEAALITIQNLYDPELILLGGRLYPLLAPHLMEAVPQLRSRLYDFARDRLNIRPFSFGASQSAVGAAALLFSLLLSEPVRLLGASGE